MKRVICTICLIAILLIAGCAGRTAYPVATHQKGDDNLSCDALESMMAKNEIGIIAKIQHDESKLLSNTFWLIVLPPLMDLKEAEKVEAEALWRRNNRLKILYRMKGCKGYK